LDCPVKALNICIVIWSSDTTVANGTAVRFERILKPSAKLSTIVGLDALEVKAGIGFCPAQELGAELLANFLVVLGVRPAGVDIYRCVQIGTLLFAK
jgi:hypothetical protein